MSGIVDCYKCNGCREVLFCCVFAWLHVHVDVCTRVRGSVSMYQYESIFMRGRVLTRV